MTRAGDSEVASVVDHLFRREAGRLVAILARRFGVAHLHLAEDVVQDALLKAMQVWPFTGVPDNPSAWLLQTAQKPRPRSGASRDALAAQTTGRSSRSPRTFPARPPRASRTRSPTANSA